jgi:hypothetical protein
VPPRFLHWALALIAIVTQGFYLDRQPTILFRRAAFSFSTTIFRRTLPAGSAFVSSSSSSRCVSSLSATSSRTHLISTGPRVSPSIPRLISSASLLLSMPKGIGEWMAKGQTASPRLRFGKTPGDGRQISQGVFAEMLSYVYWYEGSTGHPRGQERLVQFILPQRT